jgi:hypothetical protein
MKNKFGIRSLLIAMVLLSMALLPAVSAQEENSYSGYLTDEIPRIPTYYVMIEFTHT